MPDPGQNENLKNVLGFDPDEPLKGSVDERMVPEPKSERHSWPENWRSIFEWSANLKYDQTDQTILSDAENLRSIEHRPTYNEASRVYYRFDGDNFFSPSSYTFITLPEDGINKRVALVLKSDGDDYTSVDFSEEEYLPPVELTKYIGRRSLDVQYDKEGKLKLARFEVREDSIDRVSHFSEISLQGGGDGDLEAISHGDFGIRMGVKDGKIFAKRIENNEEKDVFEIPVELDVDNFKSELFPDHLLKNPLDTNIELDASWRGVDPFNKAGIKWDATAEDSSHSLTPILKPASDEERI